MIFLQILFTLYLTCISAVSGAVNNQNIAPSYFNVGVLFSLHKDNTPNPNLHYFAAILMAFEHLNNKTDGLFDDILPDTELRIIHRASNDKFLLGAMNADAVDKTDPNDGVIACVGPFGASASQGAIPTLQEIGNIPVVGYHSRSVDLGNSDFYPNFLRTVPGNYLDGKVVADLIGKYFRWEKVSVFTASTDTSRASSLLFRTHALKNGIRLLSTHTIDRSRRDLSTLIRIAKRAGARIFVMFLEPAMALRLIQQGVESDLFNEDTQIIGGEDMSTPAFWKSLNLPQDTLNSVLDGFIGVQFNISAPRSSLKSEVIRRWVTHPSTTGTIISRNGSQIVRECDNGMDYYNSSYLYQFHVNDDPYQPLECAGLDYGSYLNLSNLETALDDTFYAYDAVLSVAMGLHELIYDVINPRPRPSPLELSTHMINNLTFVGLTGLVSYSTEMKEDLWDIGGRSTDVLYNVVNYVRANNTVEFRTVLNWHSEDGFPICNNESYYNFRRPCHQFDFQTADNSFPRDMPPPHVQVMSIALRFFLKLFSVVGLSSTMLVMAITILYRRRRVVKMSQPMLSNYSRVGMMLGFVCVLCASLETGPTMCELRLWFEHLAFQLIFSSLLVRCWRVYLVTSTMKRIKVSDMKCTIVVLVSMSVIILLLIFATINHQISEKTVVIVQDQFEYITQSSCDYSAHNLITAMYAYDGLILITGLVYCWLIRKVQSTVSNTSVLVEGLVTTTSVIVLMMIIASATPMEPITQQFFVGMVISMLLLRLLWIFDSQSVFNLLGGYELDRSLILRKSEKNIVEQSGIMKWTNRIFITEDNSSVVGGAGLTPTMGGESSVSGVGSDFMMKGLEKYAKMKNREELSGEIERVKEEIRFRQVELVCLENMIFASERDSSSKKSSNRRASSNNNANNNNRRGSQESGSGHVDHPSDCHGPLPLAEP